MSRETYASTALEQKGFGSIVVTRTPQALVITSIYESIKEFKLHVYYCWFSHDVTEIQTKKLSILPAIAQEPGDSWVSRHCGEKKHRGLAVLVGLIVKLSP